MGAETVTLILATAATLLASTQIFEELRRKFRAEQREFQIEKTKLEILRSRSTGELEQRLRETLRELNEVSSYPIPNDEISLNIERLRQQISTILRESDIENSVTVILESREKTRLIKLENLRALEVDEIVRFLTERYSENMKQL